MQRHTYACTVRVDLTPWLEGEDVDEKPQSGQLVIKACGQTTYYGGLRAYTYIYGPEHEAEVRALKMLTESKAPTPTLLHSWNLNDKQPLEIPPFECLCVNVRIL